MVRISGRGTQIKRDGLEMYMLPLKPDWRPERWGSPGRGVGARVGMSAALEKVAKGRVLGQAERISKNIQRPQSGQVSRAAGTEQQGTRSQRTMRIFFLKK